MSGMHRMGCQLAQDRSVLRARECHKRTLDIQVSATAPVSICFVVPVHPLQVPAPPTLLDKKHRTFQGTRTTQVWERMYGQDWRHLDPVTQAQSLTENQQQELSVLRLQRDALLRENQDHDADLRRVIHEHSVQTTSMQDVIRILDLSRVISSIYGRPDCASSVGLAMASPSFNPTTATRSEQLKLQRLADEREDELIQLRLRSQTVTGWQPPGLPNPWAQLVGSSPAASVALQLNEHMHDAQSFTS
eukprot:6280794-Amphidinium_carterae.1